MKNMKNMSSCVPAQDSTYAMTWLNMSKYDLNMPE